MESARRYPPTVECARGREPVPANRPGPGRIVLGTTADVSLDLMRGFPSYLADQGWIVHVVSNGGPRLTALACDTRIRVHALPMARNPHPLSDAIALRRWIRLLRNIRPDAVAVGTPKAGLLSMVAGAYMRVSCRVYILRGLRLETVSRLGSGPLRAAERFAMACSHVVLAVSPSLKTRVVNLRLCSPEKIVVLGSGSSNGVDVDLFSGPVPYATGLDDRPRRSGSRVCRTNHARQGFDRSGGRARPDAAKWEEVSTSARRAVG